MPFPIIPRTPRTEMLKGALFRKMQTLCVALAEDIGVEIADVEVELIKFGELSFRVNHKELDTPWDFEVASPRDSEAELRRKFMGYLESSQTKRIMEFWDVALELDMPADEVTAPNPPSEKKRG